MTIIELRCKAFSGEGVRLNRVMVDPSSRWATLVWNSVAKHWTNCHAMGPSAIRRARKIAAENAAFSAMAGSRGLATFVCHKGKA